MDGENLTCRAVPSLDSVFFNLAFSASLSVTLERAGNTNTYTHTTWTGWSYTHTPLLCPLMFLALHGLHSPHNAVSCQQLCVGSQEGTMVSLLSLTGTPHTFTLLGAPLTLTAQFVPTLVAASKSMAAL